MTQSNQSGSQDSYLECWVRNVFWYQVASGIENFFGTGYREKKNQPEDKTNTREGRVKRIVKDSWNFTSSVSGVSYTPIIVRSLPITCGTQRLVALTSRERELLLRYLYTGPEKEICLDHMHVCWTCHH